MTESQSENSINNFIIIGDINWNVEDKEIQEFIIMNRLINIYKLMNNIPDGELDNTYK